MQEDKILNYLKGSASPSEIKEVEEWVSISGMNMKKLNLIKAQFIASTFDKTTKIVQVDQGFKTFKQAIGRLSNHRYLRMNGFLKYASILILVFGLVYMITDRFSNNGIGNTSSNYDKEITLKLENGNVQVIADDGTIQDIEYQGKLVGTQQGKKLIYTNKLAVEKLVFNTLNVPYGKRFDIVLSDGTQVFLNAGSSIRYPVKFVEGQNREVFLKGEAFFDVAKDVDHPFIVATGGLNVRVLGTKFNITSYPEDVFVNTILVEGLVNVYESKDTYSSETATLLNPGYRASWIKTTKILSLEETDTSLYTSWLNGRIIFRHVPFNNIIKKLERHYNVIITNNNKKLNRKLFTASFDVETIEQVFESFERNHGINYFIDGNQITINP